MRWRSLASLVLSGALLGGCQSPQQALSELPSQYGHRLEVISAHPFPLLAGLPPAAPASPRLRVYVEGDGHAWATRSQPSLDPTPRKLLVARLAFDDPTPSVYLARPCQFVSAAGCHTGLWTNERFSRQVLASLGEALDALKQRYGNSEFELIGYSGGAALALLLAAHREDVAQVQTLAGNLSPHQWVESLRLTPLQGSLEPLDYAHRLAAIPQRHLVGDRDKVVPANLSLRYIHSLETAACVERVVLVGVSHDQGWEVKWRAWRGLALRCRR